MNKGIEITRGKTKVLYEYPGQPDQLIVAQTDGISSGDGARKNVIAGKGRLAAQTTARVFRLLNLCGLPTHYQNGGEDDDDNEMVVRRCNMIPLEVVTRGVAAGSFVKRNPGVQRGALLVPRLIEFFVKDDANHDPMIAPEQIIAQGIANPNEVAAMSEMARLTFDILAHAWRKRDVLLVDLKIEFGRLTGGENKGQLVIADVIDNDSWRIWPQGREDLMLDKQMYRNLPDVDDEGLARVKDAYERVADLVGTFPVMRPGMAAVITDHNDRIPRTNDVVTALAQLGLPTVRHIASPATTPGYVLQLVQQLEATFARLLFVAVDENGSLRQMLDAASSAPVMDGNVPPHRLTMEIAKLLGVEDTVLYGRTLLMQANARSAVIHADAALQQQVPPGVKLG
ncbi:MAG TPA: phosphoribosylaminoimidazolesuccinocarboxamide synthase [Candidatus Acidoferrales bacterium]|jgi:phosphoribosylaminoimidazole-succinocarboxamide synthase|nr:phosphoribosylaminoimidazolesuccinocarboxamide synthase [Candidatus Acidoferrales bacterium]